MQRKLRYFVGLLKNQRTAHGSEVETCMIPDMQVDDIVDCEASQPLCHDNASQQKGRQTHLPSPTTEEVAHRLPSLKTNTPRFIAGALLICNPIHDAMTASYRSSIFHNRSVTPACMTGVRRQGGRVGAVCTISIHDLIVHFSVF